MKNSSFYLYFSSKNTTTQLLKSKVNFLSLTDLG